MTHTALSAKYEAFSAEDAAYARKLMADNKGNVTDMYTLYDRSVLLAQVTCASQPLDILNIIKKKNHELMESITLGKKLATEATCECRSERCQI